MFTSVRGGFKDESVLHPFNPQPNGDLYVMRSDGSDVRMLTDDQFEDGTPSWLPSHANGKREAALDLGVTNRSSPDVNDMFQAFLDNRV